MIAPCQLCTFYLDRFYLGVPVLDVQEVIAAQEISPVPLAGPEIHGLINLRGQIIVVLDLRTRLSMPAREPHLLAAHVLVRTRFGLVSLIVDRIGTVLTVQAEDFVEVPTTLDPKFTPFITGVYQLTSTLLLVLDTEKIIALSGTSSLHPSPIHQLQH
jgi:purine-binding chemotaxis protein CheW